MELWQIIGIILLMGFCSVLIINLIKRNEQAFLKTLYKNGEITEQTYKKYLN